MSFRNGHTIKSIFIKEVKKLYDDHYKSLLSLSEEKVQKREEEIVNLKSQVEDITEAHSSLSVEKDDIEDAYHQLKEEYKVLTKEKESLSARVKELESDLKESQDDFMNLKTKELKIVNMSTT